MDRNRKNYQQGKFDKYNRKNKSRYSDQEEEYRRNKDFKKKKRDIQEEYDNEENDNQYLYLKD